jgi:c-di-GMP-binding flagellar brake protein YcgR
MAFEEKRRYPRICCNFEVEYSRSDDDSCQIYTTSSRDISRGGIRFISLEELPMGQCLKMRFTSLDDEQIIFATGRVVWIDKFVVGDINSSTAYETGVEFFDLDETAAEQLARLTHKPV